MDLKAINITFGNAKRQADKLTECSNQLKQIRQQIDALRGSLQRDWDGDAANAFLAKCSALEEKVKNTSAEVNTIAGAIRGAANAFYNAEMRALEIANSRG